MSTGGWARRVRGTGAFLGLVALVVVAPGCAFEVGPAYPAVYYDDYPPDAYVGTTEPVYFEGHAAYWYGGHWYYRDAGAWHHYDREPPELHERRVQSPPQRRTYEPHAVRPAGRGPAGHPAGRPAGRH